MKFLRGIIKWHEKIRKEENPEANDVEMEEVEEEEDEEVSTFIFRQTRLVYAITRMYCLTHKSLLI